MSWFAVDDGFPTSKPVLRIPRRYRAQVVGIWTLAGAWSAKEETDGFMPEYVLEDICCGTPALAGHLVKVGLWEAVKPADHIVDGSYSVHTDVVPCASSDPALTGWRFKNWAKYQPTKEKKEEIREKWRNQKRVQRVSTVDTQRTGGGLHEDSTAVPHHPLPSPPLPNTEGKPSVPRKRGSRIPDGFAVSDEMRSWFDSNCRGVNGPIEHEKFVNFWQAKAGRDATKVDWPATWRNWMLNARERSGDKPQSGMSTSEERITDLQARKGRRSTPDSNVVALNLGAQMEIPR